MAGRWLELERDIKRQEGLRGNGGAELGEEIKGRKALKPNKGIKKGYG